MKYITNIVYLIFCIGLVMMFSGSSYGAVSIDNSDMGINIPMGAGLDEDMYDLCPGGMQVFAMFMTVWRKGDYKSMYQLLDDQSKEGYPFEEAKFDFQFMKFKPYTVSAIRKSGENFEFFLSYGDWKDGDKDLRKMIISGKTYKIIMFKKGMVLKKSVSSYF